MAATFRAYVHAALPADDHARAFVDFAKADPLLPEARSWADLRDYLKVRHVGRAAIKNALSAWRDYEGQRNTLRRD
ncbi:hypothetical protein [Phenylobacterium sp.]|jgi:hypothetical protein|uniref:hypothetical protein n=1 Tax=Phenylobacterium sp. TaxID=1871053 RepID=UPI002E36965F|nr:hypothetical protein [Phenylobacterium sp.]HEX3365596.1 hypothetical protein [Phenylobacterium sp.]